MCLALLFVRPSLLYSLLLVLFSTSHSQTSSFQGSESVKTKIENTKRTKPQLMHRFLKYCSVNEAHITHITTLPTLPVLPATINIYYTHWNFTGFEKLLANFRSSLLYSQRRGTLVKLGGKECLLASQFSHRTCLPLY